MPFARPLSLRTTRAAVRFGLSSSPPVTSLVHRPAPLVAEPVSRPAGKQQPCCTSKSPRLTAGGFFSECRVARAINSRNRPSKYHGSLTAACRSAGSCCALSLPATKTAPSGFSDIWELGRWRCFLNFGDRKPLSGRVVGNPEKRHEIESLLENGG